MARIAIIGDGPAGLSAALFLAKNGHDATVYGTDDTLMHHAQLHNYLGVVDTSGSDFQATARRQVTGAGATLEDVEVEAVSAAEGTLTVTLDGGASVEVDHLIIAGGRRSKALAESLKVAVDDGAVVVDGDARTSVDRVYAAGHLVRPERSQAITSAGLGAAAALDILSREAGEDVHDWDSP